MSNYRKAKKPAKKANNGKIPVNQYISACCNSTAEKPACERAPDDKKERKFSQAGLGKWSCSNCHKACKVSRHKYKKEDTNEISI